MGEDGGGTCEGQTGSTASPPTVPAARVADDCASFDFALAEAKLFRRHSSCSDGDGQLWPLSTTGPSSLGVYGVGVELYFRLMRFLALIFSGATLLALPLLFCSMAGDTLGESEDGDALGPLMGWLATTSVANLGSPQRAGAMLRPVRVFGHEMDIRSFSLYAGSFDASYSLLLLVGFLYLEFVVIPRTVAAHQKARVSPEAFSLSVSELPRRLAGEHMNFATHLKMHFDAMLRAQVTDRSAHPGMLVVRSADAGCRRPTSMSWFAPITCSGYDAKGRRLGKVIRVLRTACEVEWRAVPGSPAEVATCLIRATACDTGDCELLDARLLAQLEHAGCIAPAPCGEGGEPAKPLVHAVSLARDFGDMLRVARADAVLRNKQRDISLKEESANATRPTASSSQSSEVEAELSHDQVCLDIHMPAPRVDLGDLEDRDVLAAFVTFTYKRHRDFVLHAQYGCSSMAFARWLQPRHLRFFGHPLRVEEASAPSDIFWENLDFPIQSRQRRRRWVLMSCLALVAVCTLLFSGAKRAALALADEGSNRANCNQDPGQNITLGGECMCGSMGYQQIIRDEPPGIYESCRSFLSSSLQASGLSAVAALAVVAISFLSTPMIVFIADWERPQSLTARSHRVMSVVFFVQLINIGLITSLVHLRVHVNVLGDGFFGIIGNGSFSDFDFEWYSVVGASILLTMCLNSMCPLISLVWVWLLDAWRWCSVCRLRRRQKPTRGELLQLHAPPEFELAVQHAQQLCVIFVTLLFSAGLPLLLPLLVVSFVLMYWIDKFVLLRASCIPPRYQHDMTRWCVKLLPYALALHAAAAVWVFGNSDVTPSYNCTEDFWLCAWLMDAQKQATSSVLKGLLRRASAASALPSAAVCTIVCLMLVLRAMRALLLPSSLGMLPRFCCRRRSSWGHGLLMNCAFDEGPLQELQRLKVAHSYDIRDFPEYAFLADHSWSSASATPEQTLVGSPGADSASATSLHPIAVKFAPELVESALRGKDWSAEVSDFIRLNCPRFRTFDLGGELEVTMMEVHKHFCQLLEALISKRLAEMNLDMRNFEDIIQLRQATGGSEDTTLAGLSEVLAEYTDFCKFGKLMHDKFQELYVAKPAAQATSGAEAPERGPRSLFHDETPAVWLDTVTAGDEHTEKEEFANESGCTADSNLLT